MIVFGFTLHEEQINAVFCFFYEQRNLLIFAKTGFKKGPIFQLIFFMIPIAGIVLILMPLKLLQAEQSIMINWILCGKAIIFNKENSHKYLYHKAAKRNYICIFISLEIALLKKFINHFLDNSCFMNRLHLLTINEIHLVDWWEKSFGLLYNKIEKVWKKIPCYISLLGMFATLTNTT